MFHLRKLNGSVTISHVMSIEYNGITPEMTTSVVQSTREFIASCSLNSKEDYLEWVKNYKRINVLLTDTSKQLKKLRRPFKVVGSPSFKVAVRSYDYHNPNKAKTQDSHLYDFEVARDALARSVSLALSELYRARFNYKMASVAVAANADVDALDDAFYASLDQREVA
jgi:hypothetical protein